MAASFRVSLTARRASLLLAGSALLFATGACEKLVGIEDTTVTAGPVDGAAGTQPMADAGDTGSPQAGRNAQGGDDDSAGAANGGKSNGSGGSPNGGKANDGDAGKNSAAGKGGSSNGSAGSGGAGCNCTAGDLECNTRCAGGCDCKPPKPVCEGGACVARGPVQAPAGSSAAGTAFYIDSTEVTNAQYAKFMAAKGSDTSGQRAECAWNKSYQPAAAIGDDKRPAVNVDFCDAVAFCEWAGERLCGDLSGGKLAITNLQDASKSQWYLACAGTDDERYPYGGFKQVADACNEYSDGAMADAGKFVQCEGHYDGVFDLVGNAAEWVDACDSEGGTDDPSMDNCWLMGGSYVRSDYTCQTHFDSLRSASAGVFGFRCCSK